MTQNYFVQLKQILMGWSRPRAVFGKGDETLLKIKKMISKKRYITIGKGDALADVTCRQLDAISCAIAQVMRRCIVFTISLPEMHVHSRQLLPPMLTVTEPS